MEIESETDVGSFRKLFRRITRILVSNHKKTLSLCSSTNRILRRVFSPWKWRIRKVSADIDNEESLEEEDERPQTVLSAFSRVTLAPEACPPFFRLPSDLRKEIYDLLSPEDILQLRLTNRYIYDDINRHRGIRLRLNDNLPESDWIFETGIESLTVEEFTQSNSSSFILKYPSLLKKLTIRGVIKLENLQDLLVMAQNLECLRVEFTQFNTRRQPTLYSREKLEIPPNLKSLEIKSFVHDNEVSDLVFTQMKSLLSQSKCPHLNSFSFEVVLMGHLTQLVQHNTIPLDEYHLIVIKFITSHGKSLKSVNIVIKQILLDDPAQPLRQFALNEFLKNFDGVDILQLRELTLELDRYGKNWLSLMTHQYRLSTIVLNLRGLNWLEVTPYLQPSRLSLRTLIVKNISLGTEHAGGGDVDHLDLGLLTDLFNLEKLTLHHEERLAPQLTPRVMRSMKLPIRLKEISLSYFLLKPHQELTLLLRLPLLQKIELGYWTRTETSLAAFLTTLAFLIKFNITKVDNFVLKEQRRKMENRQGELKKLKDILEEKANVGEIHTERETVLTITKFLPNFDNSSK